MGSKIEMVNCLFVANTSGQGGGAIRLYPDCELSADQCTFYSNRAAREGGTLFCYGAMPQPVLFTDSIIWGDTGGNECLELVRCVTDRDPLFERTGTFDFARQVVVPLPRDITLYFFDPLVDLGDYRLRTGSPAIDSTGSRDGPPTDLAGLPRVCGASADAGAYELCDPHRGLFVRSDADGDGSTDLSDAVFTLSALFLGGEGPGCASSADANDDGELDLADPVFTLQYLFLAGTPPAGPFPGCGEDPTADALTCPGQPRCR